MTKKENAIALHDKGYNCCQAVACSFCQETGIDEATLFKVAEGFGLGMGGTEGTCGALTGAIIIAGLVNSTANLEGEKSKALTYQLSKEMTDTFIHKNVSIVCKDLRGSETGIPLRSCPGCIEDGVELVETILKNKLSAMTDTLL